MLCPIQNVSKKSAMMTTEDESTSLRILSIVSISPWIIVLAYVVVSKQSSTRAWISSATVS